ncbi:MAG TPA: hypothetical protein VHZ78_14510 [Rhizomicrobium sp.]|jgi:hypothetical protein|nr:hypothetical protein [Rhizomicrobium sp.]
MDKICKLEDFADKIGQLFIIGFDDMSVYVLKLTHAEALSLRGKHPASLRDPFSLSFASEDERIMPQQMYTLSNEALGEIPVFLVPSGKDKKGVYYEATFN